MRSANSAQRTCLPRNGAEIASVLHIAGTLMGYSLVISMKRIIGRCLIVQQTEHRRLKICSCTFKTNYLYAGERYTRNVWYFSTVGCSDYQGILPLFRGTIRRRPGVREGQRMPPRASDGLRIAIKEQPSEITSSSPTTSAAPTSSSSPLSHNFKW